MTRSIRITTSLLGELNKQSTRRKTTVFSWGPRLTIQALLTPIILIVFLVSIDKAFAWTITADFESGTVGAKAMGPSAFHDAGGRTTISNARAHTGSQSAKMQWKQGETGFQWNRGGLNFPADVRVGQEIWGRTYFYFEVPWSWKAATTQNCGCVQKVFRFHKKFPDGGNGGYVSVYGTSSGAPRGDCELCDVRGGETWNIWQNRNGAPTVLEPGRWHSVEQYVFLHPTDGIYRMWIDGVLKVESLKNNTATNSQIVMDFAWLMSFWNGGVPQDQVQYLDDIIITTDIPTNRDAQGNPMIGLMPSSADTLPPLAPTGLKIE